MQTTPCPVEKLRPHPDNERIYADAANHELVASIDEKGLLTPLLITRDYRIISGHRRWQAAQHLAMPTVPVHIFQSDDELKIQEALVEANRQRQKTNEQLGREAQLLLDIEKERAKRRAGTRHDLTPNLVENFPQGKARDHAGQQLGQSGRQIEKVTKAIAAIDTLEEQGDEDAAQAVREELEKSVHAGYKAAREALPPEPDKTPSNITHITLDAWTALTPPEQQAALTPTNGGHKFNRTNDNVEWALWTWNPVTGCKHNCPYCYARDIANRFYDYLPGDRFAPVFYPDRLAAPQNMQVPAAAENQIGEKNVFTCSMADLFGKWVPTEWIEAVLAVVAAAPQWNFLFLTKFPSRMAQFAFPDNAWVGTSVDTQARVFAAEKAFEHIKAPVKWLSCEPLLEPLEFESLEMFDWLVLGGASSSAQTPEFKPPRAWIRDLENKAADAECQIYEKTNLFERQRDYPGQPSTAPAGAPDALRYLPSQGA